MREVAALSGDGGGITVVMITRPQHKQRNLPWPSLELKAPYPPEHDDDDCCCARWL